MTGKGSRRAVGGGHAPARLLQAREFHESARSLITLAQGKSYNAAVTLMVTAAIAYSDAITAKARGVVNQQDHQGAPRLSREVLGNRLPDKLEKSFRKLLGRKDEVNYGARAAPRSKRLSACSWSLTTSPHGQKVTLDMSTVHGGPARSLRAHAIQVARRVARTATCRRCERKPLSCQRFSPRPPRYDIVLM